MSEEDIPEGMEVILQLQTAGAQETTSIISQLLESTERRALRAETTLWLVRNRIATLLLEPYAPSADALWTALYPSPTAVEELVRDTILDHGSLAQPERKAS